MTLYENRKKKLRYIYYAFAEEQKNKELLEKV